MLRKISITILFLSLAAVSFAQTQIPYSRYGMGILQRAEPTYLKGWGYQSAAFHNSLNLNFVNPASYGYIGSAIFEAGLFAGSMKIKTDDSSSSFADGSINTFALGLPLMRNKWGLAMGIMPYSRVNYNIIQENDSTEGLGKTYNYFEGSGGTYAAFIGTGYKWKGLSFGINMNYLFGKLDYSTILAFPDSQNAYNTLRDESRVMGDFLFAGGIQYHLDLDARKKPEDKRYSIDFGVDGNLKTNMTTTRDLQFVRFTYYNAYGSQSTTPVPHDTISSENGGKGIVVLPLQYSAGIMFTKLNHYMIGVSYDFGKWSDYSSFGEKDFTGDSWRFSAGAQWIPNPASYTQYLKLIAYRAGFSYGKNYLTFEGKDLPEQEFNVGMGFPMRRVLSEISLSGEIYRLGKLPDNPLSISGFRISLGVTLDDRSWFLRHKFY